MPPTDQRSTGARRDNVHNIWRDNAPRCACRRCAYQKGFGEAPKHFGLTSPTTAEVLGTASSTIAHYIGSNSPR